MASRDGFSTYSLLTARTGVDHALALPILFGFK